MGHPPQIRSALCRGCVSVYAGLPYQDEGPDARYQVMFPVRAPLSSYFEVWGPNGSGADSGTCRYRACRHAPPLRVLVVGAGVGGISIARGLLRDGHDVTVFEQRPNRAGRWRRRDHLVQWRDGSGSAGRRYGRGRSGAVHRADHDIHGSRARHFRRGRDGGPAGRTSSDGPTSSPARTAAGRLSDRSHPMQLPRCRGGRLRTTECGSNSKTAVRPREIC